MPKKNPKKSVRLSKNIVPLEYDIQLRPDLKNFTFEGIETIYVSILKDTKTITLHSKDIEIETIDIAKEYAEISYDEDSETATFNFPKNIKKGKVKLTLVFKGILNDKMRGFYRSQYSTLDGEKHMATTQFEATDARRAFPCFDEPAQKSIFHVSLIVAKGQTAISNTLPISVSEHDGEYEIIKFAPTPRMSTYLLAFIVGDFEYLEANTSRGIRVRVYTTPGKKHQATFALDCAVRTLDLYEEYFKINYPLPVLDMIAIPDFSSGAMENWGAVTYRESAILVDDEHSSLQNKQWVALVVAHELAHQWFGNLVTMEWWTHLWLNEGFASYIEYLAVDKLFPKWNIWTQFTNSDLAVALRLDALQNTHPIEVEVHHPDEIGEIFDEISYSKGASIIRMLAEYLGEDKFRDGLRYYLKKHSYKNTETIHLWQAFEKVSKKPVSKIIKNWTSKAGYPVVRLEIKNKDLILSQERFFASPISKRKNKNKTIWQIPVSFISQNSSQVQFSRNLAQVDAPSRSKNQQIFMSVERKLVQRKNFENFSAKEVVSSNTYIKLNSDETGFFRTAYSRELLEKLHQPVKDKTLSNIDRLGIIRDLFALSEAGTIPTTDALSFLSAYQDEDDYNVWLEIASGLARLEQVFFKNKKIINKLNATTISLFTPTMKRLGWEKNKNENHTDSLLRSLSISRLGRALDRDVTENAKYIFDLMNKGEQINPDIRGAIYSIVAINGGMREYKTLLDKYIKETLHEEKNRLGSSLGDFRDKEILKMACDFAMSSYVRKQDSVSILSSIGSNSLGRDIWWNFMKKNWKEMVSRYGEGGLTLGRAVKAISGSSEERHLKDYQKFFKTHLAPGAKRAIDQVVERIEGNIAWFKRDEKKIEKFLK